MSKGGFRSAIKKGGGFLSNVDGTLVDYEFADRFKGEKQAGQWIYFVPTIQQDGADKPVDQHQFLGAAERYEISDDGKSLTMKDGSPVTFGFSTPFGRFMDSLLNAAEKAEVDIESELPDLAGGEPLNLESIVARRFRFKQEVDEAANSKLGKRKVKKNGKTNEYDRTNTVIEALLATNGNGNGNGKAATKPSSKKAAAAAEVDADEEAATYLKGILKNGAVNRKDLRLATAKALMKLKQTDVEQAEAIKALILDEEWQESQDWLTVDKKGNLSVDE